MKNFYIDQVSIISPFLLSLLLCIAFQLTSFLLLSKQITTTSESCVIQFKATSDNQNERITLLELQNVNQDDGIQILKTEIFEHRNQISQLNKNGNMIKREPFSQSNGKENVASVADQSHVTKKEKLHVTRKERQRAARLLPLSLLIGSDEEDPEVYTRPPTSCKELNTVGHTVNGIYLIRKNNISTSKIIDVVFCNFKPKKRSSSIIVTENRLGYLNMNASSSGIYFYVQRHGKLAIATNGVIRFNKERLNIGGAMDISTGVFTVPKAGIYHFSISIAKEGYSFDAMFIFFRVNGNKVGMGSVGASVTGAPATLQPTLKLKKGDRVDLWKDNNKGTLEYYTGEMNHHFSGWLLQEDDIV